MDSLLGDFWWQGVGWSGKYIINLKLTKYSRWKLSGWLVCDLGCLKLTVEDSLVAFIGRYIGKKVSMQVSKLVCK